MAKKKRRPAKKAPKSSPRPGPTESVPDPRMMEGLMREFFHELVGGPEAETPLGRAQELMDRAYQARTVKERTRLAKQALELSPDCADAYLLLAEHVGSRKERLELVEQAVAAGERALGPRAFREDVGHFWGLIETRPYMRAREALAHNLWTAGRREEAVGHLQEMLRLNPGDNQGVRYTLASWLLDLGRDRELEALLGRYDEPTTTWAYSRALLAFRGQGDTAESRRRLKDATNQNKHVPALLIGEEQLPPEPPSSYSPGDRDEAVFYVMEALSAWRSTPGALTWMREVVKAPKRRPSKAKAPAGPSEVGKERLTRLPQVFDEWQAGFRQLPQWVEEAGARVRPWAILVTSRSNGLILGTAIETVEPTAARLWDVLAQAMQKPPKGEDPHRPTAIRWQPDPRWEELKPHLDAIGVATKSARKLDMLDALFQDLVAHLGREEPPGLLDVPGVTPDRVAGFYQAAAEFYRRAPWRSLGYENAVRVACDRFESGPWYAVVMGQSGMTLGVALYEDLALLRKLWAGSLSDDENARRTVALAVTFDSERDMHPKDLEAAREYDWEVAGPEAYPSVYRKERGMSMRPPLAWELELLEGCLRALPDFIAQHRPDDTTPYPMTVPVAAGTLDLVLSWIEDEQAS